MSDTDGVRAIVAGHGSFPAGLVSAVDQITGRGDVLLAFSNAGLGREEIEAGLRERLAAYGATVIFTDLPGGSATLAARHVLHDHPEITVVTGANLATLIDFVFCDAALTPAASARHAAEKGRESIVSVGG